MKTSLVIETYEMTLKDPGLLLKCGSTDLFQSDSGVVTTGGLKGPVAVVTGTLPLDQVKCYTSQ